jgi:hypothetical protein
MPFSYAVISRIFYRLRRSPHHLLGGEDQFIANRPSIFLPEPLPDGLVGGETLRPG